MHLMSSACSYELPDQLLQVAQQLRAGARPGGQLLLPAARLQAGPCGVHCNFCRVVCMRAPDPLHLIRVFHACVPADAKHHVSEC
jgi:hypothetical protein